ncbi:HD-GYP domain-containing protein [Thalassotalea ganghwensis]
MAELKTLTIDQLQVGMYVIDIILKNSTHKVKNQGVVNSQRTIALLKKQGVAKVVVDLTKQAPQHDASKDSSETAPPPHIDSNANSAAEVEIASTEKASECLDELATSCQLYEEANKRLEDIFIHARQGKKLTTDGMADLAADITRSVVRNEYAMAILTRIRHHSTYQWEHAINTAVLLCGFSLFLGLKPEVVNQVTLGALLHDVGNAKIPEGILIKPDKLTHGEMNAIKKHPIEGIKMCKEQGLANGIIKDMVLNHHERLDGSGYPRGLKKDKISKLARMTAIIDVYDAMTGDRPYQKAQQPIEALRFLMTNKEKFDIQIVQQFIKFLGVHPVGSIVQLSNQRLALIIQGNREEPLKPVVHIFYNTDTSQYIKAKVVDLTKETIEIVSAIKADDYNINMQKLIKDLIS